MNVNPISRNSEFDEFWLAYLQAHSHPANRLCHYSGTLLGLIGGLTGIYFIGIVAGILIGVALSGLAFVGHYTCEKNTPVAAHFVWEALCDFIMLYLFLFKNNTLHEINLVFRLPAPAGIKEC
ncbi:MAG: hypothetical protein ACI9G5_000333 [Paracoccaceae bacterium]|jgi:hypothetical protein